MDYGAHVDCTASSRTLRILNPVQNEGLRLVTRAFRSSPIASPYVESNVLALDLHRESLTFKAILRPYFLSSSFLRSLLASEDLDSSSWKFALLVHPRLLDAGIMDFNILEFKFVGTPPWSFPLVRTCLFLSKLVKASYFPSELRSSALKHAQVHAPSVPICTDRSKYSEGMGCTAVFLDFDVFISPPVVASIFTA